MTGRRPAGGHPVDLLSALLDGELRPAEADDVRSHLAGCTDCALELEATRHVRALLRDLPPVEPLLPLARAVSLRRAGVAGVAAAVAAAVASVLMANVQSEPPEPPSVARLVEAHASSVINVDPLSQLAPAAVPLPTR